MNRKYLIASLLIFSAILVSAVVVTQFISVERSVEVLPALLVTGGDETAVSVSGGETISSGLISIESNTSVNAPISILTSASLDESGITHKTFYLLDNSGGSCPGDTCEKRIFVRAEDLGISTLQDFNSAEWDASVSGYLPHLDVVLSNGETLVFEYAKVDPLNCDNSPYPTGDLNTFDDKGKLSVSSYAWLSSGPAGPCGDTTFDANHKSLSDWKTQWGDVEVVGFELEVDNWILESNSTINAFEINGQVVEVTIKPSDELVSYVETTFGLGNSGSYTITTTVEPRE